MRGTEHVQERVGGMDALSLQCAQGLRIGVLDFNSIE